MSISSVLSETTPKVEDRVDQSVDALTETQDLAQTLNRNNCESNVDNNSDNTDNRDNRDNANVNVSEEVLGTDQRMSQKSGSVGKEEVKRRRTRRSKKRKWQRLEWRHRRLQWSESTEQEVKRLHMKVVEHGQPLAPYNTTQFIMNEHNCDEEIDFDAIQGRLQRMRRSDDQPSGHNDPNNPNDPNDDDFYSSPEDESDYLQQQFHEAYDNIHAERLSSMTKSELVQEYLQLEDRVDQLEKRLKESTAQCLVVLTANTHAQTDRCPDPCPHPDSSAEAEAEAHVFEQTIKKLSEENQRLRCDNERLECILNERHSTTGSSDH